MIDDEVKKMYAENTELAAANLLIAEALFSCLLMQPKIDAKKFRITVGFAVRKLSEATDKEGCKAFLLEFAKFVEAK